MLNYRFRPGWMGTLLLLAALPVFIKLGLWQQHKAEAKQALQSVLDQRSTEAPVALPLQLAQPEGWRYRRVSLQGSYDARYQILLDNQVEQESAGYHVLTPLLIGDGVGVLINRGWVAADADRSRMPEVQVPAGAQALSGRVWLPPSKYFALQPETQQGATWQTVRQNIDLARYAAQVPFRLLPVVVRLDPESPGGYVRNWPRPAERVGMHWSYAYQWYGFALAAILIYVVVNVRKIDG